MILHASLGTVPKWLYTLVVCVGSFWILMCACVFCFCCTVRTWLSSCRCRLFFLFAFYQHTTTVHLTETTVLTMKKICIYTLTHTHSPRPFTNTCAAILYYSIYRHTDTTMRMPWALVLFPLLCWCSWTTMDACRTENSSTDWQIRTQTQTHTHHHTHTRRWTHHCVYVRELLC